MAVDLLIRAVNNPVNASTPGAAWKQGDVVCIKQIPHPGWGTQENLAGGFWIITINDLNILDLEVQKLLESHPTVDADGLPTVGRRRLYIRLASMTTSARNALESTGTYVITTARLPAFRLAITAR